MSDSTEGILFWGIAYTEADEVPEAARVVDRLRDILEDRACPFECRFWTAGKDPQLAAVGLGRAAHDRRVEQLTATPAHLLRQGEGGLGRERPHLQDQRTRREPRQQAGRPIRADASRGIIGEHQDADLALLGGLTWRGRDGDSGAGQRFGLTVYGSKGVVQLTTGSLPAAYFLDDPSWFPGKSKAEWQEITSAGLGKPETLKDDGQASGNVWIARDLIDAIENDRQPLGGMYDGRAALEMILAVYESHRLDRPVDLPLENRKHPLSVW